MLARMDIYQMPRTNSFSVLTISILFAVVRQKSRFEGENDNIHILYNDNELYNDIGY